MSVLSDCPEVSPALASYFSALRSEAGQPEEFSHLQVLFDPHKGRYLRTTANIPAGQLIFRENPQLAAPDDPQSCWACFPQVHQAAHCPHQKKLFQPLRSLTASLAEIAEECDFSMSRLIAVAKFVALACPVDEADEPRAVENSRVKKFSLAEMRENSEASEENQQQPLWRSFISEAKPLVAPKEFPHLLSIFSLSSSAEISQLPAASPFRQAAQRIGRQLPSQTKKFFPGPEKLQHLLEILENNTHQIIQNDEKSAPPTGGHGEGLFLFFAMIEHSCYENCSFQYQQGEMRVFATQEIPAGSSLSINYGPGRYFTGSARRKFLEENFFFQCKCDKCAFRTPPERSRAFRCPACADGRLLEFDEKIWRCEKCEAGPSPVEMEEFFHTEKEISLLLGMENPLDYIIENETNNPGKSILSVIIDSQIDRASGNGKSLMMMKKSFLGQELDISHFLMNCLLFHYIQLSIRENSPVAHLFPLFQARLRNFLLVIENPLHWTIGGEWEFLGNFIEKQLKLGKFDENTEERENWIKECQTAYSKAFDCFLCCFGPESGQTRAMKEKIQEISQPSSFLPAGSLKRKAVES